MKNGQETRPNGSKIIRCKGLYFVIHHVDGIFKASKNGPWDYLHNARKDADDAPPPPIQNRFAMVNNKRVEFENLEDGDEFKLYESDGAFIAHCLATGQPFRDNVGVWTISCIIYANS